MNECMYYMQSLMRLNSYVLHAYAHMCNNVHVPEDIYIYVNLYIYTVHLHLYLSVSNNILRIWRCL